MKEQSLWESSVWTRSSFLSCDLWSLPFPTFTPAVCLLLREGLKKHEFIHNRVGEERVKIHILKNYALKIHFRPPFYLFTTNTNLCQPPLAPLTNPYVVFNPSLKVLIFSNILSDSYTYHLFKFCYEN